MKNKLFNKVVGIVLSSSIIVTGIISSPPAFAEESTDSLSSNAKQKTNKKAVYAEIENAKVDQENNNSAIIQIDLDKSIENTDMPISVYKNDNPKSFKEISKGGKQLEFEIKKDKKEQYLTIATGNSSQEIIVNPQVDEVKNFEITVDKTVLKNTGTRPTISWETNSYDEYSEFKTFIVNSNEEIVYSDDYFEEGEFNIPYFYKELEMSYTMYVADNDLTSTNLSNLTQIKAISNLINIKKMDWNINLSINLDKYKTDDKVEVSWTSDEVPNGYYTAYLVNESNGNIVTSLIFNKKINNKEIISDDKNIFSGMENKFSIYIAKNSNSHLKNISELENIQYKSNIVSSKHEKFNITAKVDPSLFYTYNNSSTVEWIVDQPLNETTYEVYGFNLDTGETLNPDENTAWEDGWFDISWDYLDPIENYQLYVIDKENFPTESFFPHNISDLNGIEIAAKSEIVKIERGTWTGTAAVTAGKEKNKIVYQFNQPISPTTLYLIDKNNGKIINYKYNYDSDKAFGEIEYLEITDSDGYDQEQSSWFDGNYKIVILANDSYYDQNYSQFDKKDILFETDVKNNMTDLKWYISLSYNPISDEPNKYNFKVATNRTNYGDNYSSYVVKDSTGEIIYKYSGEDYNFDFNKTVPENESETYTAYVADNNDSATNYSQLTNIVSNSDSIYPKFVPSRGEYKPNGGRFSGGFNPSSNDCQQQCSGDPVNNYTGEYFENSEDLNVDSNSPLSLTRNYSTFQKDKIGLFGLGTTTNYDMSLIGEFDSLEDSDNLRVIQENGSIVEFLKAKDGSFISSQDTQADLIKINNTYVMKRKTGEKFVFDNNGKLIKVSNLFNKETTLTYNNNKLTKITADDGKYIKIDYNSNNLIKSITDGTREISYTYDSENRLIEVQSYEFNNSKKYSYDSQNRVSTITHPNSGIYKNFYDSQNRVIKQINPVNGETLFNYEYDEDYEEYITSITLPDGSIKVDNYDSYGRLVNETFDSEREDLVYYYDYNPSGQVTSTEDPDGNEIRYLYDENGNIQIIFDELGRTTRYTYNEFNQVVEKINPNGNKFTNTYNDKGMLKETEDENGNITKYETTNDGKLTKIINPEEVDKVSPKSETISYDTNGFISQQTSPEGGVQKIVNNPIGLPVKTTDSLNNSIDLDYNENYEISKKTYPNGSFEEYEYDTAGRLIKHIDILNNESTYTYNKMDSITSLTTETGTTNYEYDNDQRLVKSIEANGATTNYKYDGVGRLIEIKNAENNISTLEYDYSGNVVSETDFNNNVTSYDYDYAGNMIEVIDSNNNSTYYEYDELDRLKEVYQANGFVEQYKYDNVGNLINLDKNDLDITKYKYNKNNQLIETEYSDLSKESRLYNSNGSLASFKNRDEKTTSYNYNLNNQLTKTIRPDSSEELIKYNSMGDMLQTSYDNWATVDKDYEYNGLGQLTKTTNDDSEINYSYNSIGQLSSRGPPSKEVDYTYDSYGNINNIVYPSGKEVQYSYNLLNNIDKVESENETIVEYDYDSNGNVINENYGNDVNRENSYDRLDRLKSINIQKDTNQLYNRSLTYDKTYLIKSTATSKNNESIENQKINYSGLNKLTQINNVESQIKDKYNLDNSSNLIQSPKSQNTFSNNGQLETSKIEGRNYSYEYDDRGNRTVQKNGNNKFNNHYSWTDDNKLESIAIKTKDDPLFNVDYTYDASGLLQTRSKNDNKTDDYIWDTSLSSIPLLLEDSKNEYIYGNDNSPIAQVDKDSGDTNYLHGDERGSVVLATDSNGNGLLTRDYDAYGNHTEELTVSPSNDPPSDFKTNFAYAGEYLDEDTNLYNLRARWYEPLTGSFISEDPLLPITGEAYSYASGNPLSFVDPLGLSSTGNSSTAGNIAAGFFDGLIGFPVVEKISNYISPGSVDTCSDAYKYSGYAGFAVGFIIPGGAAVKGGMLAAKAGAKGASLANKSYKTSRISNIAHFAKSEDEYVKLYRAVSLEESNDIRKLKHFRPGTNSVNGKYFFRDKKQAYSFADNRLFNADDIFEAKVKSRHLKLEGDLGGVESSGGFVDAEDLYKIIPIKSLIDGWKL